MKKLLVTLSTYVASIAWSFAGPLDGVWLHTDAATRSIPRVEISGTQFVWWGKTLPQDTKYGPIKLTLLGDSVSEDSATKYGYASADAKFADELFIVKRVGDQLVLEALTIFKDGSNRANTLQTLTFNKQP